MWQFGNNKNIVFEFHTCQCRSRHISSSPRRSHRIFLFEFYRNFIEINGLLPHTCTLVLTNESQRVDENETKPYRTSLWIWPFAPVCHCNYINLSVESLNSIENQCETLNATLLSIYSTKHIIYPFTMGPFSPQRLCPCAVWIGAASYVCVWQCQQWHIEQCLRVLRVVYGTVCACLSFSSIRVHSTRCSQCSVWVNLAIFNERTMNGMVPMAIRNTFHFKRDQKAQYNDWFPVGWIPLLSPSLPLLLSAVGSPFVAPLGRWRERNCLRFVDSVVWMSLVHQTAYWPFDDTSPEQSIQRTRCWRTPMHVANGL